MTISSTAGQLSRVHVAYDPLENYTTPHDEHKHWAAVVLMLAQRQANIGWSFCLQSTAIHSILHHLSMADRASV